MTKNNKFLACLVGIMLLGNVGCSAPAVSTEKESTVAQETEAKKKISVKPKEEPAAEEEIVIYDCGLSAAFKEQGVIYENGIRYTYYSSNVLYHYRTPEWALGPDGIYRTSEGYVVVASSDYAQGTIISTPFGQAQVLDCGCASGTVDVYTCF